MAQKYRHQVVCCFRTCPVIRTLDESALKLELYPVTVQTPGVYLSAGRSLVVTVAALTAVAVRSNLMQGFPKFNRSLNPAGASARGFGVGPNQRAPSWL